MKKIMVLMLVGLLFLSGGVVRAEGPSGPVEKFVSKQIDQLEAGCKTDVETYCKDVTPGEGRIASCIYAHSDKISPKCEKAMYDSAQEFEMAGAMLNAFAAACQTDIEKLCAKVELGEGRILKCLEANQDKVSPGCNDVRQLAKNGLGPQ